MAYTPLTERVAKRMAEIQGLHEKKPERDLASPSEIRALLKDAGVKEKPAGEGYTREQMKALLAQAASSRPSKPFFRMTPYQIMRAVRDLKKKM